MSDITMAWLYLAGGIVLLVVGGEFLVRGAVALARRLGMSELMIGLTLVGMGTSTPELITSVRAALEGSSGIAVGNVVGSNIANVLLIFGVVCLIRPVEVHPRMVKRDGFLALMCAVLLVGVAQALGGLDRWTGAVFVALLVAYLVFVWRQESQGSPEAAIHLEEVEVHQPVPGNLWLSAGLSLAGLALLMVGASGVVEGAVTIARAAGLSETVIGLTVVAVGTSLPELVSSLMAALKGKVDAAFGGIVGSNLYNILAILGITALVQPIAMPPDMGWLEWSVLLGSGLVMLVFAATGQRVNRVEGGLMVAGFAGYTALLLV